MIKSKTRSKKVSKRTRKPAIKRKASTQRRNPHNEYGYWEDEEDVGKIYPASYILTTYPDNDINIEGYTGRDPQHRSDYLIERGYEAFLLDKDRIKKLKKLLQKF